MARRRPLKAVFRSPRDDIPCPAFSLSLRFFLGLGGCCGGKVPGNDPGFDAPGEVGTLKAFVDAASQPKFEPEHGAMPGNGSPHRGEAWCRPASWDVRQADGLGGGGSGTAK